MSQSDFGVIDPNTKSGTQLAVDLNGFRDAVNSGHSGATRPAYLPAGGLWVRIVSSTKWDLVLYDGAVNHTLRSINPATGQKIGIPAADLALGTAATATLTTSSTDSTAGRVMKVGDFGLGLDAVAVADANTIPVSGVYRLEGASGVNGPLPNIFFTLVNYRYGTTSGAQIATGMGDTTGQTWVRAQQANVWGAWQQIALINSPAFTGIPTAPTAAAGTNTTQLANTAFVKAAIDAVGKQFTKEYVSAEQTITSGAVTTLAHGLGVMPKQVQVTAICKTAEAGYAVGNEIPMHNDATASSYNYGAGRNVTNIRCICGSAGIAAVNASGEFTKITNGNWRLIVRAWA